MRITVRSFFIAGAALTVLGSSGQAQAGSSVVTDLLKDVNEVQEKLVGLAKAIPADKNGWRPAAGVRSVGEVVMHVAGDNYFIPAAAGTAAPASTGITAQYNTVTAYETRRVDRDAAIAELQASFEFLKHAMQHTTPAAMAEKRALFGQEFTMQQVWIMATTHLHEHLGQLIAYARSNGVVPPWSK